MSYKGQSNTIIFGFGGFNALENQERIPPHELQEAKNIRFDGDMMRKAGGLEALWPNTPINGVCIGAVDYWPTKTSQKIITAWDDGNIYVSNGTNIDGNTTELNAAGGEPVFFLKCGEEQAGNNAKCLALSTEFPPQVLDGDTDYFVNVNNVSSDWTNYYPAAAILHDSRAVVWGNDNARHALYFSTLGDHADFSTELPPIYDIAPGSGQYVTACHSLQTSRLMIFKYPRGIYMIDTENLPSYYLPVTTVREDIGCPSAFGVAKVGSLGTFFIGCDAHIYSLEAVMNPDADIVDADITELMGLGPWLLENISTDPTDLRFARLVYNSSRKEVWATFRKPASTSNDIALIFNVKNPQAIRISVEDRAAVLNATWLTYNQTSKRTEVYCAGADGLVYRADMPRYSITVGATETGYAGVGRTPDTDFGMPEITKRFDWLEFFVKSVGEYPVYVDVHIDGEFYVRHQLNQGTPGSLLDGDDVLAPAEHGEDEFTLSAEGFIRTKLRCGGFGKTLSLKFSNEGANEGFAIAKAVVYFKPLGTTGEK